MTAVANPPSFQQINRSAWGANGGQGSLNSINPDEVARMFMPRKSAQRANSSSSISSNATSSSSATTIQQPSPQTNGISMPAGDLGGWNTAVARKKPQRAGPWPPNKSEPIFAVTAARSQSILGANGTSTSSSMSSLQQPSSVVPSQHLMQATSQQQNGGRQTAPTTGDGNPVLYLLSMNGTFERKTIQVPFYPDSLRIGRQTNAKTVPTPSNGFFDSKVLSRQHAEIWADRNGKIWIRDVRSSNGTFVNGTRLSAENRDSEPHELQTQDHLELGIDIVSEDQKTVVHHKVAAKVEHAGFLGPTTNVLDMNFGDLDPANGSLMLPSQNGMQLRGRTNSQGSVGSGGRFGPPSSIAATNMSSAQQRPMNFWLTPITTEQIVKRLTVC
jgi:FHA domain